MAVMKRGGKTGGKQPKVGKPAAEKPKASTADFDPMAVARKPLPKLTKKQQDMMRVMFAGGASTKDVAGFLRVDVLTVEELLDAQPDLRPKKAKKTQPDAAKADPDLGGRPTAYEDKYAAQANVLASLGATDMEQAQFFGVSIRTLHRWKVERPEFREALEMGKDEADAKVEKSLYQRATGYTFDSEKILVIDEEVVRVETLEHVPPDTKAAMFWLQNRRPGLWRSVNHIKHDVEPEGELAGWLKNLQKNPNTLQPIEHDPESGAGVVPGGTIPVSEEDDG